MEVCLQGRLGTVVWVLPPDAEAELRKLSAEARQQVERTFADYLQIFCHAALACFGSDAATQLLYMTMLELKESLENRKG